MQSTRRTVQNTEQTPSTAEPVQSTPLPHREADWRNLEPQPADQPLTAEPTLAQLPSDWSTLVTPQPKDCSTFSISTSLPEWYTCPGKTKAQRALRDSDTCFAYSEAK